MIAVEIVDYRDDDDDKVLYSNIMFEYFYTYELMNYTDSLESLRAPLFHLFIFFSRMMNDVRFLIFTVCFLIINT